MSCPVCDRTMQAINTGTPTLHWCNTCGTLRMKGGVPDHEAPMLVERVRKILTAMEVEPVTVPAWSGLVLSLREAVGLPLRPEPKSVNAEQLANECPGHGRGGQGKKCCDHAGKFVIVGEHGSITDIPCSCSCHD